MARTPLSQAKVAEGLAGLESWSLDGDTQITKSYIFRDHIAALGFVVKVATVAETLDHHPTVSWTYNKVSFVLSTHDAGGLTQKDFQLAERIDSLE